MPDALDPQPVLEGLDKLLADRPDQVTHDFSAATRRLTTYHDTLIRRLRDGSLPTEARRQLDRINAVIRVVYACHYPLRRAEWDMLEKARAEFVDLSDTVFRARSSAGSLTG